MKSQSRFYLDLLSKVLSDIELSREGLSFDRDFCYIKNRYENEGIHFLTVSLPNFGKSIVRGIESSSFKPPLVFKTRRGRLLPEFLQGLTKLIFSDDGSVKSEPDPVALQELNQICMLLYKLEIPYSSEQELQVVHTFINNENVIPRTSEEVHVDRSVLALARDLLSGVFRGFDPRDIQPKHGPGAVATGEKGNCKFTFRRKYQRLHQEFPYYRYFSPSLSRASFESGWYRQLLPELSPIAKVCLVPKDSRGPRLISMEPLEIQWIQQGLLAKLVSHIESHRLTRGKVRFLDQTFNQNAALLSSKTREFATLDLKDASDRVSLSLFRLLFPEEICKTFEACRSVATQLPDGTILPLRKFAPMGSALCFPVMALTIWSLVEATLRLNRLSTKGVLVYGDDLVVPTASYSLVVDVLTAAGLSINEDKSYKDSNFRESCGCDAFLGHRVEPSRLKKPVDKEHLDPSSLLHLIELSEAFFDKGFWQTCRFLRRFLRSQRKIPWTHDKSHLGFYSPDVDFCLSENTKSFKTRYNPKLQRTEVLVPTVSSVRFDDYYHQTHVRMLKGLLGLFRYGSEDYRVTRRRCNAIKWRWCST